MMRTTLIAFGVLASLALGSFTAALAQSLERAEAAYYRGDYADAMRLMTPLAEGGDRHAQYLIGFMHERGQGVPKDYLEAAKWYGQAADLGHPFAQNNLGVLYKHGRGVTKNPVAAYKWFSLAADGYSAAEFGHRERAIMNQQNIAAQMTTEQIVKAKKSIERYRDEEPGVPEYRAPNVR